MLPSVKTLKQIAPNRALELRKILEIKSRGQLEAVLGLGATPTKYPVTASKYYHPMPLQLAKLSIASEITEGYGVEGVSAGHNAKSPAFDYVNQGDTYATTLLWIAGRGYRVGCWGDIVERGNYD